MGILPVQFQILDPANTAFMLLCTSLVMLMTPGLAFLRGLVQRKGILTIMFQSFVSMSWVAILWFAVGYSLAFGPSLNGIIGNPLHYAFLQNINANTLFTGNEAGIPILVHFVYQMMFAIITPALITGAFVGRVKFKAYLIFITLWTLFVYCPFVHMVWSPQGVMAKWGVVDFAGGIVVHATASSLRLLPLYTSGVESFNPMVATTFLILLWGRDYCGLAGMGLTQALNYRLTQLLFLHLSPPTLQLLLPVRHGYSLRKCIPVNQSLLAF